MLDELKEAAEVYEHGAPPTFISIGPYMSDESL
jgi:hypothetical protein